MDKHHGNAVCVRGYIENMNIPFSPPDISQSEIDAVVEVLKSGWITTGPVTKQFERELSEFYGTHKTVCLSSGTAALELTLRLLGIGPGDEVITSVYTYSASCSVIIHVGATPVLLDTAKNSFHINYDDIAKSITPKTKAIIPIDIGGVMCDYEKIYQAVKEKAYLFRPSNDIQSVFNRVIVIADAAHSLGASFKGSKSGQVADFTCFSFHAVKNLTTAEGGAVTWVDREGLDNETIYHEFQLLSLHGQNKDALEKTKIGSWEYDIVYPGYKFNMTDIMAALGLAQLHRYNQLLSKRKEIIQKYDSGLSALAVEILKHFTETYSSSGHLYMVKLIGKTERERNEFIIRFAEKGISTNVHYKPLPMHSAYKKLGFHMRDYPNAYREYENEVTLPLYSKMHYEQIDYILDCFCKTI